MYNILLVDDEKVIVDGMTVLLGQLNPEKLFTMKAYSGDEALKLSDNKRVDILLTDISMPEIDGFGLYERMLEKWPYCRVIFMTGYETFDYAYKAIQYKNIRYIIKAEGVDTVLEAVKQVIAELDDFYHERQDYVVDYDQIAKNKFIQDTVLGYLNGNYGKEVLLHAQLDRFGLRINLLENMEVVGMRFEKNENEVADMQWLQYYNEIDQILKNYLKKQYYVLMLTMKEMIFWLLQRKPESPVRSETEAQEYLMNLLEPMQIHLKNVFGMETVIVVHRQMKIAEIRDNFLNFYNLLQYHSLSWGNLMTYEDLLDNFNYSRSLLWTARKLGLTGNRRQQILTSLKQQSGKGVLDSIKDILDELEGTESMHNPYAQELYFDLSVCILSHINKTGMNEKIPFTISIAPLTSIDGFSSWKDAVLYLKNIIEGITQLNGKREADDTNLLVDRIEAFIKGHLEQGISIAEVAGTFHFNSNYLSGIYKTVRGATLADFITEEKMKHARNLLIDTEIKVQKIGERLGYSTPANFIRSFKKHYGITPNEYRRKYS